MMKQYITTAANFVSSHKREVIAGSIGSVLAIMSVVLVALFIVNHVSKIAYQPPKACELFTPKEAQDLMGINKVISVDTKAPVVSGNVAMSKCSYTDTNPTQELMRVAAIAVRSGVNDEGVAQNKKDFESNKPTADIEEIKDLGDSAYFEPAQGQLNVLRHRDWVIISYGVGASPAINTVEDAVNLAHKVLK